MEKKAKTGLRMSECPEPKLGAWFYVAGFFGTLGGVLLSPYGPRHGLAVWAGFVCYACSAFSIYYLGPGLSALLDD